MTKLAEASHVSQASSCVSSITPQDSLSLLYFYRTLGFYFQLEVFWQQSLLVTNPGFPEMENHEVFNQAGWPLDPQRNKGPGGRPLWPNYFPTRPGNAGYFALFCCFFVDLSPSFVSLLSFAWEREGQGFGKAGKIFYWPEIGKASYSCFISMPDPLVGDGSLPPSSSWAL